MIYINEIFSINYQESHLQKFLPFLDFFVHELGLARVKHITFNNYKEGKVPEFKSFSSSKPLGLMHKILALATGISVAVLSVLFLGIISL